MKISKKYFRSFLSLALALSMMVSMMSPVFAAADGGDGAVALAAVNTYTSLYNTDDGFFVVTNYTNNVVASTLSVANEGIIIEVDDFAFKDLNGNGTLDTYEDWRLTPEARATNLVSLLTEENDIDNIAPLLLASMHVSSTSKDLDTSKAGFSPTSPSSRDLLNKGMRTLLNASSASTQNQAEWNNAMQAVAEADGSMFGIPVNIMSDPRSSASAGHNFSDSRSSAVSKWPGSLGFAATFDPSYTETFGSMASREYRALGITTALSPQIDMATEPRWSRVDGTYGESSALSAAMSKAYTKGFQSTYTDDNKQIWSTDSVAVMLKHWPGDGSGEGGRESHANVGKYAVYPGDNLEDHLIPFTAVMDKNNKSATTYAASVMPSYSVGIDVGEDGKGKPQGTDTVQRGSGVSKYKLTDLLQTTYNFGGYVCSDWGVAGSYTDNPDGTATEISSGTAWGTSDLGSIQRLWTGLKVGMDMYGGLDSVNAIKMAYKLAEDDTDVEAAAFFADKAKRILLSFFRLGLFEDPYLNVAKSVTTVGNLAFNNAGYEAQQASIVMLKNSGNVISEYTSKQTVYIPMLYTEAGVSYDWFGNATPIPASIGSVFDAELAEEYFNVLTDSIKSDADMANLQESDIVRRTDFTGVDFAFIKVNSPTSPGGYFDGYGVDYVVRNVPGDEVGFNALGGAIAGAHEYDPELPIDNGYFPKTIQYGTYYADPANVRAKTLGLDADEEAIWENVKTEYADNFPSEYLETDSRYYGGKSVTATNKDQLDIILNTVKTVNNKVPVVVAVAASSAMVFNEFENKVDGIVLSYGTSNSAILDVVSGKYEPNGLLPMQMPADMETVEAQEEDVAFDMYCHVDTAGNVYGFAYGLNWNGVINDSRVTTYAAGVKNETRSTYYTVDKNTADGFSVITNYKNGVVVSTLSVANLNKIKVIDGLAYKNLSGDTNVLHAYEDWSKTPEERAEDLVGLLTADSPIDKIAPLLLASMHFMNVSSNLETSTGMFGNSAKALVDKGVRSVLNAASSVSTENQAKWTNAMQAAAETDTNMLGIPVNIMSDPRSSASAGDNFSDTAGGAVSKWPGSLGFAATFNPSYTEKFGKMAAQEYRALGITTALSPQIDMATEPRWSRVDGTYGESSALSAGMSKAYTKGFQSTYTGDKAVWGTDSVAVMLKHWPGDGSGEGGRESHANVGKYAVYPGDNLSEHMIPFTAVMDKLNKSETTYAASVMPSYSIGIDKGGEPLGTDDVQLGSGASNYKLNELLFGAADFGGYTCSDWGVGGFVSDTGSNVSDYFVMSTGTAWGTENIDNHAERIWTGLKAGMDMYGGLESVNIVKAAYELAVKDITETEAAGYFAEKAERILLSYFRLGLFEDSYISVEESVDTVGSTEFNNAGYEAQTASVVMLKNEGNVISQNTAKQTVYIPLRNNATSATDTAINWTEANKVFTVVTDTFAGGVVTRRTDFSGVDFTLVKVNSPTSPGGYFDGYGVDYVARNVPGDTAASNALGSPIPGSHAYDSTKTIDNGYYPKTIQYGTYYANPANVRAKTLGLDAAEEAIWEAAKTLSNFPAQYLNTDSRYYGGKSVTATNKDQLDVILNTAERVGNIPVVIYIAANSAMVFNEFESKVDGIVMGFGISDAAALEVLSGKYEPNGLLPMQMPADMETVEAQEEDVAFDMYCHVDTAGNVYGFAYGLNWKGVIKDSRVTTYATGVVNKTRAKNNNNNNNNSDSNGSTTAAGTTTVESGTLTYTASQIANALGDKDALVINAGTLTNVTVNLPISALGSADLVVETSFGTMTISNSTLQELKAKYGDTLGINITRSSFKVELLVGGTSVDYNDPAHPLTISLPVTADGRNTSEFVLVKKESGKNVINPLGVYKNGEITVDVASTGTYDVIYNGKSFSDTTGNWSAEYISFAAARELVTGAGDGTFSPNTLMNRAMFARLVANLEGADLSGYTKSTFSDVPEGQWYTAAIAWAADNGILNGAGNGKFSPLDNITREQMAVLLYNYTQYKGYELPDDADVTFADKGNVSSWAAEAAGAIAAAGIIGGKPGGVFDPQGKATRAEVAAVFAKFISAL